MRFVINAWLEQQAPRLQLIDPKNRRVVLTLEHAEINKLLETGLLDIQELIHTPCNQLHEVIKELLLIACCKHIYSNALNPHKTAECTCMTATSAKYSKAWADIIAFPPAIKKH